MSPSSSSDDADFSRVTDLLRGGLPAAPQERPSEEVWRKILTEVHRSELAEPVQPASDFEVIDLESRRSRSTRRSAGSRRWAAPIAAAAALIVAVPLTLFAMGRSSEPARTAELLALSAADASGNAELQDRTLSIDFNAEAAPADSYYELWLLDIDDGENLRDLRSIGQVENGELVFEVPEGIDLELFDVVDVSLELADGDESHSGNSVLRGELGST